MDHDSGDAAYTADDMGRACDHGFLVGALLGGLLALLVCLAAVLFGG